MSRQDKQPETSDRPSAEALLEALSRLLDHPNKQFANELVEITEILPEPWKTAAQAVVDNPFPRMDHRHHPILFIAQAFCCWFFAVYWDQVFRARKPVFPFQEYRKVETLQARVATLLPPDRRGKRPRIPLALEDVRAIKKRYHDMLKSSPRAGREDTDRNEIIKQIAEEIGYPSPKELKTQLFRHPSKYAEVIERKRILDQLHTWANIDDAREQRKLKQETQAFLKSGKPSPERPARPKRRQ